MTALSFYGNSLDEQDCPRCRAKSVRLYAKGAICRGCGIVWLDSSKYWAELRDEEARELKHSSGWVQPALPGFDSDMAKKQEDFINENC